MAAGVAGRSSPTGARLRVTVQGRRLWRLLAPGYSFLSSSDPRVHVGVGSAGTVDRVEARWPDGRVQRLEGLPVNRVVVLF